MPGTEPGVEAFERLTELGINVNMTLLFAVERYSAIAEAYVRALSKRLDAGEPVDRAASVASFFVSRVDTKVDAALEQLGREDLRGKAAVANARVAYARFQEVFSGEAWERLRAAGANVQRPLWASTSTKNPDYPDTLYVDELIGPDTVNTMPDATIDAARDHATAERTVDRDVDGARALMRELVEAGVDVDDIVLHQLVDEGVKSFSDSYDSLLADAGAQGGRAVGGGALGEDGLLRRDRRLRRCRASRESPAPSDRRPGPPARRGSRASPETRAGWASAGRARRGPAPRSRIVWLMRGRVPETSVGAIRAACGSSTKRAVSALERLPAVSRARSVSL